MYDVRPNVLNVLKLLDYSIYNHVSIEPLLSEVEYREEKEIKRGDKQIDRHTHACSSILPIMAFLTAVPFPLASSQAPI